MTKNNKNLFAPHDHDNCQAGCSKRHRESSCPHSHETSSSLIKFCTYCAEPCECHEPKPTTNETKETNTTIDWNEAISTFTVSGEQISDFIRQTRNEAYREGLMAALEAVREPDKNWTSFSYAQGLKDARAAIDALINSTKV